MASTTDFRGNWRFGRCSIDPWVIPGESLHQEFELLASAGVRPAAIPEMTGENAARALDRRDVGIVEPGRRADLILLAADPLVDISNTRRIAWVMQGGRVVEFGRLQRTSSINQVQLLYQDQNCGSDVPA